MKTQLEEIQIISNLLDQETLKSFRNLESINTGSDFKNKDEIISSVCSDSRKYRRITSTIQSCLNSLIEGGTINQYYNWKLEQSTRENQCEQDRIESMEELELFTDLIVEL